MSAEPRQITNNEVWTQWEGRVVDGAFPLRRFLGGSSHSGVFVTQQRTDGLPELAIKFVPADTIQAEAQLVQWGAASALSHPHLVRLFDVGRYRSGGRDYLFVVMEYADQTLAQILARRALAPEEVREMLLPTLDALTFLHRKQLVHGRLKPSNFLAVGDQLKLASDTIRPISHSATGGVRTSAYDPPELKERDINAAGDIWSLGMTLAEALTQRTTAWPDETVSLPANLPAPFANVVQRCLSVAPAARPTVLDIEAQFKPAPSAQAKSTVAPPVQPAPRKNTPPQRARKQSPWLTALSFAPVISLAVWLGLRFIDAEPVPSPSTPTAPPPPVVPSIVEQAAEPQPRAADPVAAPAAENPPAPPTTTTSADVVQEVMPDVPQAALERIRGRIHVTVRVLVAPSGEVIGTLMENPGPSKQFARLAEQAAGEWKFAPADMEDSRVWALLFVFSRDGVAARATPQ